MAAVLACGRGAVLSHGSAADLWSIRGSHGLPEVTRQAGGTKRPGVLLHQTRILEPAEVTKEAEIPVTSLERALLDIAPGLGPRQLEHAVVAADRTGRLRWPELHRLLARTPRRAGVGRLRCVVDGVSPHSIAARSPLEVDFLMLCRSGGLPMPEVNVLVEGYLVDFLWPAERVVAETDGYAFHSDRSAFERDHRRAALLTAAGYDVHRVSYEMLRESPDLVLGNVRRSLDRRRASQKRAISPET
jgi:hypothetical protein